MPWKETRVVDERTQFIAAVLEDPRGNFTRLCARFGISRAKGYKWLTRYRELGPAGLEDQKPIARSCPHQTPPQIEDRIVELRKEHPFDGAKKLRVRLLNIDPSCPVPSASTIGDILDRRGLLRPRRARLRVPPHPSPLEPCSEPNELWCVDFKGHFLLGDRTRCHPLTISDAASRYLLKCEALASEKESLVRPHFERAFREFGLPERMRSDNGAPFASKAIGGLSTLSVWWIQLGIKPERIEPGCPQQNPRHERMHRTLKQNTANPPSADLPAQQRAHDRFRADYNNVRPHEALGQTPPASHYEPSLRPMPERVREPEYGEAFEVRRVTENGSFKFRAQWLCATRLLRGQPIGLRAVDDDEWELFYGPLLIGHVLVRGNKARVEPIR